MEVIGTIEINKCICSRSLRRVIDILEYMFEADFYLPRSMMACLRIEELKDALDYQIFPPEAGCASVYFFLKTLREHEHYNEVLLITLKRF